MSEIVEKQSADKKVNSFIEKNKKVFIIVGVISVVVLACYIAGYAISKNIKAKDLAKIDEITFTLVDDSMAADAAELDTRRTTGIEELQSLVGKSGIVGARANMLAAELSYQLEKYDEAASYWEVCAKKAKKTYISPIAYYNLGVCYEQLGKLDEATNSYKIAAENEDFVLNTHAQFSYGRTLETQGKYADAVAVYTELNDKNPDDSWANLGKTRILTLQAEGKAE